MSLRQLIAATAPDRALVVTPEARLDAEAAAALGPAGDIPPEAMVVVCLRNGLSLIRILAALDGHVAGLLLLSASLEPGVVAKLAEVAGTELIVSDRDDLPGARAPEEVIGDASNSGQPTRWMMTTSGTTGIPKIVPHTLASLTRTVRRDPLAKAPLWGLVLEPSRFAGLQVVLQALAGGGTLLMAPPYMSSTDQVAFLGREGVTHLSATPTLWRRLLMVPGIEALPLKQVTLGGEIADQGILDALARRFPDARITHIYASTEAGVGFAVNDRQAGFPLSYLQTKPGGVEMKLEGGALWLRPPGAREIRYLGGQEVTRDAEGYVLTGDLIETREDRAVFLGRDSGTVNVGGVKVSPERVERTIAAVEGVGLVAVSAKKSPITGALLVATVVAAPEADTDELKPRILAACRASLEREAVPARILFAETLPTNAAGKILRS